MTVKFDVEMLTNNFDICAKFWLSYFSKIYIEH